MVFLILGGIGLISIYYISEPMAYSLLSMTGVGIAWASILSMPYAMLLVLYENKIGVYMGIFNILLFFHKLLLHWVWMANGTYFGNNKLLAL